MLGKQENNSDLFQCVTMEDLVPANHLLRRLKQALDLSFVVDTVADCYAKVGRTSFYPQVIARIRLLQHLYDYSERQVCDEIRFKRRLHSVTVIRFRQIHFNRI